MLMGDKDIIVCVDTNILVEFRPFDQVSWAEIAPNAVEIRVVIPPKVSEEMDDHKKKTGRLRRRGLEFVKTARRVEESADQRAVLCERNPRVTIEFSPVYRRTELDSDLYDLEDKDGRIVAESARFMADHPGTIFLSDDSKPIRLARQTGLLWRRPPESWRRQERPDERDQEIAELRRELGAQPALSITFPGAITDSGDHILEPAPAVSCAACSAQLLSSILAANPKVPREESVDRYGIEPRDPFGLSRFSYTNTKLTEDDLIQYEKNYAAFEENVRWWTEHFPEFFGYFGRILPIDIELTNDGDRAAERVLAELELTGAFHFVPLDFVANLTEQLLMRPSAPRPHSVFGLPLERPEAQLPHEIYLLEEPKVDEPTTRLKWRCEEFRQGQRFVLPTIVRTNDRAARGTLKVRVSSAVMAKATTAIAVLVSDGGNVEDNPLCGYLRRRVKLLPRRYQEPALRALTAVSQGCSGGSTPVRRNLAGC